MATHLNDREWQLSLEMKRDKQMEMEEGEQKAGNINETMQRVKKKERRKERYMNAKRERYSKREKRDR